MGDDVGLQAVHVLVLVDEHVIEGTRELRADHLIGAEGPPVEQQVVEVQDAEGALARSVGAEERRERLAVLLAPGIGLGEHLVERPLGVDGARVDVEQRLRPREAPCLSSVAVLLAHVVQDVGRVAGVEDPEARSRDPASPRGGGPSGARSSERCRRGSARRRERLRSARVRARSTSSRAARRVKLKSRMRSAGVPSLRSHATRAQSVVVFPVPAPARIRSGPPAWVAATR